MWDHWSNWLIDIKYLELPMNLVYLTWPYDNNIIMIVKLEKVIIVLSAFQQEFNPKLWLWYPVKSSGKMPSPCR